MGLLLLLTFTLLSSYFHPGRVVNAQESFMIRAITLSIEPSSEVPRGTNVTLRCQAVIGSSGQEALSREYTIFKGSDVVYAKTSSTSEDLLYPLPEARISNTGSYACKIKIEGKQATSDFKELTVTGLSKPVLHINKSEVTEGEQITARCTAPGETGSIFFFFYEGSKQLSMNQVKSNQAEAKISLTSASTHQIHCAYTVVEMPHSFKSNESNIVNVKVNALAIEAVLKIFPQSRIYEGDQLFLSCTVRNFQHISERVHLYLYQGNKILSSGDTKVNHSVVALAKDPGEFECIFKMGGIEKSDKKKVSVTELFSVPTLTISPAEVFQREYMTLTCKSESSASERLGREELTYTFDPPVSQLSPGVYSGWAPQDDLNYTCVAQAKGIMKHSKTLTVRPKVSVSTPKISVVGKAVLKQPFKILCLSDIGSLPINYTLLRGDDHLSTFTVERPAQKAHFTINVTKPDDISKYKCEAKNSHKKQGPQSERLNATVIVPLTQPTLTVVPDLLDISEGDRLYLICGVKGTPPVTFKWYHAGQLLYATISTENNSNHQISSLSKEHSGTYFCEADNHANNVVRSDQVTIEVRLALWKKLLIGGFCLLALSVLVVVCVLCFRSKRGKREAAAELSVKPSSPKSDDSLTVTLTHDTEVYNADTDAAPLYDGTEGRVTNGARDSVASLPVDISNRSSYSIPATV